MSVRGATVVASAVLIFTAPFTRKALKPKTTVLKWSNSTQLKSRPSMA
eukprot:CAMPEP_0184307822 /NCGR_PEP_ID=MMETSP1049-20130417/16458_1 /TAXON_ID=77928 /ORGANISM="Proteomonas sulcata, Strain CCMP704" /LENGTH=47 /DNA_ID= /DNA_START= /DNA_END= /DNA_ORIENTATION=